MRLASLLSFLLLASSCAHVQVPDTKICGVEGRLSRGARCDYTLHDERTKMTTDEFLDFLEPTDSRGAAICQSAEDWNKMKTALEQACFLLKKRCTYQMRQALAHLEKTITFASGADTE